MHLHRFIVYIEDSTLSQSALAVESNDCIILRTQKYFIVFLINQKTTFQLILLHKIPTEQDHSVFVMSLALLAHG